MQNEDLDDGNTPKERSPGGKLLRRLPWLLLAGAMVFLVVRHYGALPSEMVVNYKIGGCNVGLVQMDLEYRRADVALRAIRYRFDAKEAPSTIAHKVSLPDGDYQVVVDLYFRKKVPPIRTRTTRLTDRAVRLTRTLPVRGGATVDVVIADES